MKKNRIFSLLLALVLVLGVIIPGGVFATNTQREPDVMNAGANISTDTNAVTNSVTLHKLMMDKATLKAWDSEQVQKDGYDGTQDLDALKKLNSLSGKTFTEIDKVYFVWQVKGQELDNSTPKKPQYIKKAADSTADLVKPAIDSQGQPEFTTNLDEAFGGLTTATGIKYDTSKLKGTFLIQEIKEKSTYKKGDGSVIVDQKAVPVEITLPLVNDKGTVLEAHVYPKNTEDKPQIDKNLAKNHGLNEVKAQDAAVNDTLNAGADFKNYEKEKAKVTAEVGKEIPYEVKTRIAAGTSYERLVWTDIMTNGLTFKNGSLNLSIQKVTPVNQGEEEAPGTDIIANFSLGTHYDLITDNNGFTLRMKPEGLKEIEKVTKGTPQQHVDITLTYKAIVNGTAVVDNPEENSIKLEYGHKPDKDLEKKPVKPQNGELKVNKTFQQPDTHPGLKLVYTLYKNDIPVASVMLNDDMKGKVIDCGNGITFEVDKTTPYNGTFKGLEKTADVEYKFVERVAGYDKEYTTTDENGNISITNKKDNDNPKPLEPKTPKVVNGGKKFVKTDESATKERLTGATFVVKNAENKYLAHKNVDTVEAEKNALKTAKDALDAEITKYNALDAEKQKGNEGTTLKTTINQKQQEYNKAFHKYNARYEWVDSKDTANVVKLISDGEGRFEITGLAYGTYKLEETVAPKGYALRADQEFTVGAGSYNQGEISYNKEVTPTEPSDGKPTNNDALQVINKKVIIPQTGGIGTLVFIVAGIVLMGGALIALKRNKKEIA